MHDITSSILELLCRWSDWITNPSFCTFWLKTRSCMPFALLYATRTYIRLWYAQAYTA